MKASAISLFVSLLFCALSSVSVATLVKNEDALITSTTPTTANLTEEQITEEQQHEEEDRELEYGRRRRPRRRRRRDGNDRDCCRRVCYDRRRRGLQLVNETSTSTASAAATSSTTLRTTRQRRRGEQHQQQPEEEEELIVENHLAPTCHYDCSRCRNPGLGGKGYGGGGGRGRDYDIDRDSYDDRGDRGDYDRGRDDDDYDRGDDDDYDYDRRDGDDYPYIHDYGSNDLGLRFNKFDWPDGKPQGWRYLRGDDYPLRGSQAEIMRTDSRAVSIILPDDHQYRRDAYRSSHAYILAVGGYPTQPSHDPYDPFWAEMEEVVDWQYARHANVDPNSLFRLPDLWQHMTVHDVAEAVHDEYPASHQAAFTSSLWGDGATLDEAMFPFRCKSDFIGFQIKCSYLNSWAIATVGPITFRLKWVTGRPRPEELAYLMTLGKLTEAEGVPPDLYKKVMAMDLKDMNSFGSYEEGCPKHPAWPAMHSAGSTSSFWLRIILNLSDEQYCQALLTDYAVAMARTVAGVHYRSDNIDGLNLGQEVVAERLADVLAEIYGSDRDAVQAKIDRERFDWRDFDPDTCMLGGGYGGGYRGYGGHVYKK